MSKPVAIPPGQNLIDIRTAADMLGRCRKATIRHLEGAKVPVRWLAGKRLYRLQDIQAFIDGLPTSTGPGPVPKQLR